MIRKMGPDLIWSRALCVSTGIAALIPRQALMFTDDAKSVLAVRLFVEQVYADLA